MNSVTAEREKTKRASGAPDQAGEVVKLRPAKKRAGASRSPWLDAPTRRELDIGIEDIQAPLRKVAADLCTLIHELADSGSIEVADLEQVRDDVSLALYEVRLYGMLIERVPADTYEPGVEGGAP